MSASTSHTPHNSEQYNQIADAYSVLYPPDGSIPDSLPLAAVEEAQLRHALVTDSTIDIRGKRILDLACGGGHYSSKYLRWTAASVRGVDISSGMLEAARTHAKSCGVSESELSFF